MADKCYLNNIVAPPSGSLLRMSCHHIIIHVISSLRWALPFTRLRFECEVWTVWRARH